MSATPLPALVDKENHRPVAACTPVSVNPASAVHSLSKPPSSARPSARRAGLDAALEALVSASAAEAHGALSAAASRVRQDVSCTASWVALLIAADAPPPPSAGSAATSAHRAARLRALEAGTRLCGRGGGRGASSDAPLLSLWLAYAADQERGSPQEARDTFKYLRSQRVGDACAALWVAWAGLEARLGRPDKALAVLAKAREHEAAPEGELLAAEAAVRGGSFAARHTPQRPHRPPGAQHTPAPGDGGAQSGCGPQNGCGTSTCDDAAFASAARGAPHTATATSCITASTGSTSGASFCSATGKAHQPSPAVGAETQRAQPAHTPGAAIADANGGGVARGAKPQQQSQQQPPQPQPPPAQPRRAGGAVRVPAPSGDAGTAAAPVLGGEAVNAAEGGAASRTHAPTEPRAPADAASPCDPPAPVAPAPAPPPVEPPPQPRNAPSAPAPHAAGDMAPPPPLSAAEVERRAAARAAAAAAAATGAPPASSSAAAAASAAAPPAPAAPPPGGRVREDDSFVHVKGVRYTKLECVGQGGTCKVFKVMAPTRRVLAVKRIRLVGSHARPESVDNFREEVRLLERLRGRDHIIQLVDSEFILQEAVIYIVLEYGETDLARLLARRGASRGGDAASRLDADQNFVRLYFQQMVEAVGTIHAERIVHSDLKPPNFLVVEGVLKLIDFGIAKAMPDAHGAHDTTNLVREHQVGTINYMSPEAVLNGTAGFNGRALKIGRASDIWSLGCILYQMVYGSTPFSSLPSLVSKLHAIANSGSAIAFPDCRNGACEDLMRRALERDPARRITLADILAHPFIRPPCEHPPALPGRAAIAAALCGAAAAGRLLRPSDADALAAAVIEHDAAGRHLDVAAWLTAREGEAPPHPLLPILEEGRPEVGDV